MSAGGLIAMQAASTAVRQARDYRGYPLMFLRAQAAPDLPPKGQKLTALALAFCIGITGIAGGLVVILAVIL